MYKRAFVPPEGSTVAEGIHLVHHADRGTASASMRAIASAPEEAVRHSYPQRPKSRLNVSRRSSSSSGVEDAPAMAPLLHSKLK